MGHMDLRIHEVSIVSSRGGSIEPWKASRRVAWCETVCSVRILFFARWRWLNKDGKDWFLIGSVGLYKVRRQRQNNGYVEMEETVKIKNLPLVAIEHLIMNWKGTKSYKPFHISEFWWNYQKAMCPWTVGRCIVTAIIRHWVEYAKRERISQRERLDIPLLCLRM